MGQDDFERIEKELNDWVHAVENQADERRDLAVEKIKAAYQSRSISLCLSHLGLTSLPCSVFSGLKHLQELDLSANRLRQLSVDSFDGLVNLNSLLLHTNQLRTISEYAFKDLAKLQNLSLGTNQLSVLPENIFEGLNELKNLDICANHLCALPAKIFASMPELVRLDLSSNQLKELPEESFSQLIKLKQLDLRANQLNTLPEKIFKTLKWLSCLDLSLNQLHILPERVFRGLYWLDILYLHHNQLSKLPKKIFERQRMLHTLDLRHNLFVFKPEVKIVTGQSVFDRAVDKDLCTEKQAFTEGNQQLLSFQIGQDGAERERGKLKLEIMLKNANKEIAKDSVDQFVWRNSSLFNQLFYQASLLPKDDPQNKKVSDAARKLLKAYLKSMRVQSFIEQARTMNVNLAAAQGFLFVSADGEQSISLSRAAYEALISNASCLNKAAMTTLLTNGIQLHKLNEAARPLTSMEQLMPFPLLAKLFQQVCANAS